MKPTPILPEDPGLPGLTALRHVGLHRAVPELGLGDDPVELTLHGYSRGLRATLEAKSGERRLAVKCYARDPGPEAGFYEAMGRVGLNGSDSAVRVPLIVAWRRDLGILVIEWLSGPTAGDLIASGQGARAGDLAARWIRRAASLSFPARAASGAGEVLSRSTRWVAALAAAHASLGSTAGAVASLLGEHVRESPSANLVNGRLYVRHVIDLGRSAGIIDWEHFGEGALEIDAGMFLATLWRAGRHESKSHEAVRAAEAFLAGTAYLLDEKRLAWHRAGALLSLAYHMLGRRKDEWRDRAGAMLGEALHAAETAAGRTLARRVPRPSKTMPAIGGVEVSVGTPDAPAAAPAPRGAQLPPGRWMQAPAQRPDSVPERAGTWLTDLDLSLMRALWSTGEATAQRVAEHLPRALAAAAVGEHLSRLVDQGVVSRRVAEPDDLYRAQIGQSEVQRSVVEDFASLAGTLFEGDMPALVCQLLRARDVNAEDIGRVIALLAARERELEGDRK